MLTLNCHTIKEIAHQPQMWMDTYDIVCRRKDDIAAFFKKNGINKESRIILTGAGTSAFIADTSECIFVKDGYHNAKAVSTTDIVSTPESFLSPDDTLFISFGRSGDSPESVAAYNIARKFCKNALHLIITCNPNGFLAKSADPEKDLVIVLPDGTNDRSLAMTSSFSSMLAASILCKNIAEIEKAGEQLKSAAAFASAFLSDEITGIIEGISRKPFSRAVFLGSGALKGIACECHLKLQELTDGQIMCTYDSFMGLRHGPKAVINKDTLVVYLLSDEAYTKRYELDLIDQVNGEGQSGMQVIVSTTPSGYKGGVDFEINAPAGELNSDNEFRFIPYVLIGQLLGYNFSLAKGLNPDTPAVRGTISRVVSGVKIY